MAGNKRFIEDNTYTTIYKGYNISLYIFFITELRFITELNASISCSSDGEGGCIYIQIWYIHISNLILIYILCSFSQSETFIIYIYTYNNLTFLLNNFSSPFVPDPAFFSHPHCIYRK